MFTAHESERKGKGNEVDASDARPNARVESESDDGSACESDGVGGRSGVLLGGTPNVRMASVIRRGGAG